MAALENARLIFSSKTHAKKRKVVNQRCTQRAPYCMLATIMTTHRNKCTYLWLALVVDDKSAFLDLLRCRRHSSQSEIDQPSSIINSRFFDSKMTRSSFCNWSAVDAIVCCNAVVIHIINYCLIGDGCTCRSGSILGIGTFGCWR
jgi:hypothetical protein